MDIKLIKELNDLTREKDEFERALEEAGIEMDIDMGNGENNGADAEMDIEIGSDEELKRLADQYREREAKMSDDDLRDAIGDDLEQLEYQPEDIARGIEAVMSMLGRSDGEENEENDINPMDDEVEYRPAPDDIEYGEFRRDEES